MMEFLRWLAHPTPAAKRAGSCPGAASREQVLGSKDYFDEDPAVITIAAAFTPRGNGDRRPRASSSTPTRIDV